RIAFSDSLLQHFPRHAWWSDYLQADPLASGKVVVVWKTGKCKMVAFAPTYGPENTTLVGFAGCKFV
ncbi:hypothetical protein, partial [Photorhabdus temperata]|uniref:hypothetical protein n=1 Tax=Photorhabdus temperata TaxID=574560 RepID=UPI0013E2C08A